MKKFLKRFLLFFCLPVVIFVAFVFGSTLYIRNWMPEHFDYQDSTAHFSISYNESEKAAIEDLKSQLENNYDRITTDLKQPMDKPVNIKIYPDLDSFHFANKLKSGIFWWINIFKKEESWVVGNTDLRGDIMMVSPLNPGENGFTYDDILKVAVHEFTHAVSVKAGNNTGFIRSGFGMLINEGLAVYEAGQGSNYEKDEQFNSKVLEAVLQSIDDIKPDSTYRYYAGYSFVKYVVENYGYDKIVELLKKDYSGNNYDNETKDLYNEWLEYLKAH